MKFKHFTSKFHYKKSQNMLEKIAKFTINLGNMSCNFSAYTLKLKHSCILIYLKICLYFSRNTVSFKRKYGRIKINNGL